MRKLIFVSLVTGCYDPDFSESMFACSEADPRCPDGQECRANQCVPEGTGPSMSITITEPEEDAMLEADQQFTLAVAITGLTLNENFPDDPVDGQGHWHWFIDDVYQAGVGTTETTADPLEAGCHILKVDLRQNNHEAVDPPVSDQVSVYSNDGGPTICIASPPAGETVDPGKIAVDVDIRNFVLDDTIADGHGHWHAWIDETLVDAHFSTTGATVTIPSATGEHTIKAELVDNEENPLSPPRTATATVTVP
jgi:hypothetical protein